MTGLSGRLSRVRGAGERGAIGVIVGVLLGGGLLLGTGALVVDVGQLYQERAELQNGADAGALALARACAHEITTCLAAKATGYANANAKDGASAVDLVCGWTGAGVLPACPAPTGELSSCAAAPASGTKYVEVHTSTLTDTGSTLLPPTFARTLAGDDYEGTTVGACARVAWGSPAAATVFSMTISYCEWLLATSNGTSYAPAPPYPPNLPPTPSMDRVLHLHGDSATTCPGQHGRDGPGIFGWVDSPDGNCSVTVSGTTYPAKPGLSATTGCEDTLRAVRASHSVVFIPVFNTVTGDGSHGSYSLAGFAAFVVTGYRVPGASEPDWLNPLNDCHGSDNCVTGYFTRALVPAHGVIGGPDLGALVTQLTG